jgi:hypothetical protein
MQSVHGYILTCSTVTRHGRKESQKHYQQKVPLNQVDKKLSPPTVNHSSPVAVAGLRTHPVGTSSMHQSVDAAGRTVLT